ncbi:MAG: DUF3291 domain-containing protein [Actinomycetota bacterium]|nr:DUF3291 domain-containing protein [Actinomycetota bacterium]
MTTGHRIAQVNIARAKQPLDSPLLAEFVAALEPVNALADAAPGFVWRLQDETGDATSIRAYADELMIVNMSVWESIEALWEFVYDGGHLEVMRRRREWFSRIEGHTVLWWIPAGHIPTVEEAKQRLELLAEHGPAPDAFTFKRRFPPPGTAAPALVPSDEPELAGCPAD